MSAANSFDRFDPPDKATGNAFDRFDKASALPTPKFPWRGGPSGLPSAADREHAAFESGRTYYAKSSTPLSSVVNAAGNPFGFGDLAAAAADRYLGFRPPGEEHAPATLDEARAFQRGARAGEQEAHPVAAGAGNVGGTIAASLAGGRILAPLVEALPGGAAVSGALKFTPGQRVANAARAAGAGGAMAGGTAAIEGEDADKIASDTITGGALGLAGSAALSVGGRAFDALKNGVVKSSALRVLAQRIRQRGESASQALDRLATAFANHRVTTGRAPTIAETVDAAERDRLASFVGRKSEAQAVAQENADAIAAQRPHTMRAKIEEGGPVTSTTEMAAARNAAIKRALGPIRDKTVPLKAPDIEFLAEEVLPNVSLTRAAKLQLQDAVDKGTLTIDDLDLLRRKLGDSARARPGQGLEELRDAVAKLGATADPAYARAISEYRLASEGIRGAKFGRRAATPNSATEVAGVAEGLSPSAQAGAEIGARARLADRALATPERLARDLASNAGLDANLKSVLSGDEVARLQALGRAETRSAENLSALASGGTGAPNPANVANSALHAAAGHHWGAGALLRYFSTLGPSGTAKKLAEMLTSNDPRKVEQAIAWLRRRGANDDTIEAIRGGVVAASAAAEHQVAQPSRR